MTVFIVFLAFLLGDGFRTYRGREFVPTLQAVMFGVGGWVEGGEGAFALFDVDKGMRRRLQPPVMLRTDRGSTYEVILG